jgi:RHS repeat-associated protein
MKTSRSSLRAGYLLALAALWLTRSTTVAQAPPPVPPACYYFTTNCPDFGDSPGCSRNDCKECSHKGVPGFWVSEPYINLRLEDEPLGYNPGLGGRVSFHLSYRQRGAVAVDPNIFSAGPNWSCSFRAYLVSFGGTPESLEVHRGGAGWILYTNGMPQYRDGSILTSVSGGYQIEYADGAKDVFTGSFTEGSTTFYFLTSQTDPTGAATTYTYSSTPGIAQLVSVTDPDGNTTSLYYNNTSFPNQITKVVDPFSRACFLTYDSNGYLTDIVDVAGLASSFTYDPIAPGWITTLTTPYGSTTFTYGGVDMFNSYYFYTAGVPVNRSVLITLPTGGSHLYVYRQDCSAFMSSTYPSVPSTTPFGNTLDNVDQQNRNSFHWGPMQYSNLGTSTNPTNFSGPQYALGRLYHWLTNAAWASPWDTVSLERAPTPDGTTSGQITWYDYFGKSGGNNYIGTNNLPSLVALVLPDGTTRYSRYTRNGHSAITQDVSTYSTITGLVGQRTNSFYYAANNIDLLQQVGPLNEQIISNYFATGNTFHEPNASYDAFNQQTLYTYNANGQLTSVTPPTLLTTTNSYFTSGAGINRVQYSYDFNGSQTFRSNAFTYASGLVQTLSDERGVTVTKLWDSLQRLTSTTYPDASSVSNIYTNLDLAAVKDRNNNWTYFGYDSLRHKIAETNANSVVTRYGYCDCGALTSITNAWSAPEQFVTSFGYDNQENETYVYLPDFTITNWFNSMQQLYRRDDERGTRYLYYNNQGLQTNVSNAYGTEVGIAYDNEDRPVYVTDANGITTTKTYDLLGRVSTNTYPNGSTEMFGYSPRGLTAYTNQLGMFDLLVYDAASRRVFLTNANSKVVQFYHDASGNLTNLVDGKGQSTKWNYDEYSRLTNKLDQAGAVILRYGYDPAGRLLSRWSAAFGTTYYTNDAVGNLTYIDYPHSTNVSLQYDSLNRLTNMVDASGTTKYTYTAGNQLLTETQPFASSSITNTYVNRSRTSLSLQQPAGVWTNAFTYDAAGRLTNVASPAGSIGWTMATPGPTLIRRVSLPNSCYIINGYDSMWRETISWLRNSANTTLDSAEYGYNLGNQRSTFTNLAGTYVQYSYDNIGQLVVANSSVSTENQGYTYDAAWNLNYLTNNGTLETFTVDNKNQLTGDPNAANDSYDANGNLQLREWGGLLYAYTNDDENQLIAIEFDDYGASPPLSMSQFVYDGLGRMRKRIEYTYDSGGNPVWSTETHYIYDGTRVIQERDTNNTPTGSYTRGTDLSGTLEGAGGIGGLLSWSVGYSAGNWSTHYFYHADVNGNITYLVDSSQGMAATYRYDPFGNTISSSGPQASANVYRFSSKECNTNSGAYYFLYRFYDPSLQRWLNRDPLEEDGGVNLYGFVENDPVNHTDAFGLADNSLDGTACQPGEVGKFAKDAADEGRQYIADLTKKRIAREAAEKEAKEAAKRAAKQALEKEKQAVRNLENAINKAKDIQKAQGKDRAAIGRITKSEQNMKTELRDIMNDHNQQ